MKATITITSTRRGRVVATVQFEPTLRKRNADNPVARAAFAALGGITSIGEVAEATVTNHEGETRDLPLEE